MSNQRFILRCSSSAIVLAVAVGLLLQAGTARATNFTLDAYFTSINGDASLAFDEMGVGSFTADDVSGAITAFSWQEVTDPTATFSWGAFSVAGGSSVANFNASGDLTGLFIFANNGTDILTLALGDATGGRLQELSMTGGATAIGIYGIVDGSGTTILGGPATPEPSAPLLFFTGLAVTAWSGRRRRLRA